MVISCHSGKQKSEYLSDDMVARSTIYCQHCAQQKSSLILGNEYTMSSCLPSTTYMSFLQLNEILQSKCKRPGPPLAVV